MHYYHQQNKLLQEEHDDKQIPMIVDFWLSGAIVARQQKTRMEWYKQRGYYIL